MIEDLPVMVALPPPLHTQVAAWVEQDLGWQVVDRAGPLAPVLALAERACGVLPWIAVTDGPPAGEDVRRQLTSGAIDVIGWPHDRLRIPLLAAQVDRGRGVAADTTRLTIAGCAGGVGTSTIALAIGGILAWSGASTLVSGDAGLVQLAASGGAPGARADALAPATGASAPGTPSAVAGVPRLSVVGGGADVSAAAWSGDVVVVDGGTALTDETTLVVSRPDRSLRRAAESGRAVMIVGDQPLGARDCRRVLGRAPLAHLPVSARVARAGLVGRVPAALPGTWLSVLRAGLARLEEWSR